MLLHVRIFHRFIPVAGATTRLRKASPVLFMATLLFTLASQSSISVTPGNNFASLQTPSAIALSQSGAAQRPGLNIVVLDPAHGGIDPGARGTGGIRESEVTLAFVAQIRRALESQGLQVVQTRTGNEDPSFDDRSAIANAQRGAVFVTVHVASTGTFGQARAYSQIPVDVPGDSLNLQSFGALSFPARNGFLPWDRAQEPYLAASRKFAELVQSA